jgi:hypothetical protein
MTQTLSARWEAKVTAAIARGKREILADIMDRIVPATVKDFATLHDYVDANCYGGLCEDGWTEYANDEMTDECHAAASRVQDELHQWLQQGRPTDHLRVLNAVAGLLPNADVDFPGVISHPGTVSGTVWCFGTANENWGGDLSDLTGETVFDSVGTDIPSTETDAEKIADAILAAMRLSDEEREMAGRYGYYGPTRFDGADVASREREHLAVDPAADIVVAIYRWSNNMVQTVVSRYSSNTLLSDTVIRAHSPLRLKQTDAKG